MPASASTLVTQSQRRAAKIAGLAWPISFVAVALVSFNIFFPLNEPTTATELARRILENEQLYRMGIAGYLLNAIALAVHVGALYVLLEPVDRVLVVIATLTRLVWVFTWVVVALNLFMVLHLASEGQVELAQLYLGGWNTYYVGQLFLSVAAAIVGYVLFKSRYVPRALAVFGVVASVWCAFCMLAYFVFPGFADTVNVWWFDSPMFIYEATLSAWLLFTRLP